MSFGQPADPAAAQHFEFEPLRHAKNYRHALVREFSPWLSGDILEVGAGVGHMTALFSKLPSVRRLVALEPEADFCKELRRAWPNLSVVEGTISAIQENAWNAIICINVLEHIADDEQELKTYYSLLRPRQGFLCLFVPARQELYAAIDLDFGHHRRYGRAELAQKLRRGGFETVRLNYFNSIGYFIWWLSFKLLKHRRFAPGKIILFDRVIFPIVYGVESRFMRPPLGQSLIAVARARKDQ